MAYHAFTPDETYLDFEPMLGLTADDKSRSEMRRRAREANARNCESSKFNLILGRRPNCLPFTESRSANKKTQSSVDLFQSTSSNACKRIGDI